MAGLRSRTPRRTVRERRGNGAGAESPAVESIVCTMNQSVGAGRVLLVIWRLYLCALLLAFTFHLLEVIECIYDTWTWDTLRVKFREITFPAATPNLADWVGAAVRPGLLRRAGALCFLVCLTKVCHLSLAQRRAGRAVGAPADCAGASREARPVTVRCACARRRLCGPSGPPPSATRFAGASDWEDERAAGG